jgi:hypothetical protein
MNYVQYSVFGLLVILASSMFAFVTNIAAYAIHPIPVVDGTVTKSGCRVIEGTIVIDTVDARHTQSFELCKFGNQYFRIVMYAACIEEEGVGKDPDTGKVYTFPTPCDVPKPCDAPDSWGKATTNFGYYDKVQVTVEGKQFDILTDSTGAICNILEFIQEEKKISLIVKGVKDTKRSIAVIIPNELLNGEFKVMVDGRSTEFNITKTEIFGWDLPPSSTITIGLDFSQNERRIDIIGTQVIPEFPAFGLIILATSVSIILATRLIPKKFSA